MTYAGALKQEVDHLYTNVSGIYKDLPEFSSGLKTDLDTILKQIPEPEMNTIIEGLRAYNAIISETPEEIKSPGELHKIHLKSFLNKFGVRISDKFFTIMDEDVIVEVYSKENRQLFRSVNFFKTCKYDFYTLSFIPWDELFHRKPEVTKAIFNTIQKAMLSGLEFTQDTGIPNHFITEVESGNRAKYESVGAGSLFCKDSNEMMGYLGLIKITPTPSRFSIA